MSGSNCASIKLLSGGILLVTYLAKSHQGNSSGCSVSGPGPKQLATTPATPHLQQLFNIKTEAIQGSGFSPGKGGGRHFLTHDQITPLYLPPTIHTLLSCPSLLLPSYARSFRLTTTSAQLCWGNSRLSSHLGASPCRGLCVRFYKEGPGEKKAKDLKCI